MPNNAYNAGQNIGSVLGDLLTGSRREPGKAYYDQMGQNYDIHRKKSAAEEAYEDASRSRSMNIARDGITPELMAKLLAGDNEAKAQISSAILRSAQTPNLRSYTGGALDLQELGFRDAAVQAGTIELGVMNGNLAGVASGPIKTNAIDAGYQLNPFEAGGAAVPTQGELGDIRVADARAGEIGARENLANVKAAGKAGKAGKTLSAVEADAKNNWIIAQANKKIASGDDKDYVEAWVANEMAKAGITPADAVDEPLGEATKPGAKKGGAGTGKSVQENGKLVVEVVNKAAARAAWAKLPKGAYLRFPNGSLKRKD